MFKPGQIVDLKVQGNQRTAHNKPGGESKVEWQGPFQVVAVLTDSAIRVQQGEKMLVVHPKRLRLQDGLATEPRMNEASEVTGDESEDRETLFRMPKLQTDERSSPNCGDGRSGPNGGGERSGDDLSRIGGDGGEV